MPDDGDGDAYPDLAGPDALIQLLKKLDEADSLDDLDDPLDVVDSLAGYARASIEETRELRQTVDELEQELDRAIDRTTTHRAALTEEMNVSEAERNMGVVDVTEQFDELDDEIEDLEERDLATKTGGRLGYLMGAADDVGLEHLDDEVGDVSQREADAAALYRAFDDLSDTEDTWRLEDRMKGVLASMRGVDVEDEYQDGEMPNNRVYRACEKLQELTNGAICYDQTELDGGRKLSRL